MTITSKLSKLCGLLYKLRPFVDKQILMQVYYTLIYPNLLYGITCWVSCSKIAFQPIQIIHNRILRCINMIGLRQIHVSELYILSNVFKVHDKYVLKICKFIFQYKLNLLPNIFLKKFYKTNAIHTYNTRNAIQSNYYIQRKQRAVGQRTLQYRGAKYWNDLPNSIKSLHHKHAFTKLLKQHLINNYKQ